MDAVVVGAGLAGLSCAHALASAAVDVEVLEAGDVVGGRTASWSADGMVVESGLHRFLGVYRELPALLRRCGALVDEVVFWEDEIEIRVASQTGNPATAVLGAAPLHAPLRTVGAFGAALRLLSPVDLASLGPFMAAGTAHYVRDPVGLAQHSVAEYAKHWRVTERTLNVLLVPLTAGIFFLPPERYSAADFFGLVAASLPRLPRTRVGAFRGGMTDVLAEPIARAIRGHGGRVTTGAEVRELLVEDAGSHPRIVGVRTGDEVVHAAHVILATSLGPAQSLLRPAVGTLPWFEPMLTMPTTPSVTVQFELDRPSMRVDHTTFGPGTVLASFAEQSRTTFPGSAGRLSVILTDPDEFLGLPAGDVIARTLADAGRLGLDVEGTMIDARVVSHPHDFPCLEPGFFGARPPQRTPVPGLTLAGDYTRQRWLATMEGAVLSGQIAAQAVVHA